MFVLFTQHDVQFCLIFAIFSHTHTHNTHNTPFDFLCQYAIELPIIWLPTTSKQNDKKKMIIQIIQKKEKKKWETFFAQMMMLGSKFPSRFCCCRVSAFIYSVKQLDEMMEKQEIKNKKNKKNIVKFILKYHNNNNIFNLIKRRRSDGLWDRGQ